MTTPVPSEDGLRVLHVVHTFPPDSHTGTEIHTLELNQALLRSGLPSAVFAPRVTEELSPGAVVEEVVEGVTAFRAAQPDPLRPDANPVVDAAFREVVSRWRPDLIHFQHCAWGGEGLPEVARELALPSVMTLHDYWSICPRSTLLTVAGERCAGPGATGAHCLDRCWLERPGRRGLRKAAWAVDGLTRHSLPISRRMEGLREGRLLKESWVGRPRRLRSLLALPSALIAPSEHVAHRYRSWGADGHRIVRIPHGVDGAWVRERSHGGRDAEGGAPVRFGYIGTPLPHKGLHLLVEAFSRLPQGRATLTIHAGLDQPDNPYAQELAARCQPLPGVTVAGGYARDAVGGVYASMDVLVVPSVWEEMFGLVVLEARLAGVAVVVTEVGGLPELVRNRVDGLVVPPQRVDPLERALLRFVDDPGLAARMAAAAGPVRTMEECARETAALYAQVAGQAPEAFPQRSGAV